MADEPFTLLSISVDKNRKTLEAFIAEEDMDWPQVWDRAGRVTGAFGVKRFPTYILIDYEGRPVGSLTGESPQGSLLLTRQVGSEVKRARKALERSGAADRR